MPDRKQLPMLSHRAAVQPKTFDADKRTVELTWSTGATVRRFDPGGLAAGAVSAFNANPQRKSVFTFFEFDAP